MFTRKPVKLSTHEYRFIEENNAYKNEQKVRQRNQKMPPGMASQDLMAYWGISPFQRGWPVIDMLRLQI